MNTNITGSATGIDLAVRKDFVVYWRKRYQYSATHAFLDEFGNFCTPKDDPVHMGWEAWQAALAHATTQHTTDELYDVIKAVAKELDGRSFSQTKVREGNSDVWRYIGDAEALAKRVREIAAATPLQHSVTEQASIGDDPEFRKHLFCLLNAHPRDKAQSALIAYIDSRAQQLPSTAASEQASAIDVGALRRAESALLKNGFTRLDDLWIPPTTTDQVKVPTIDLGYLALDAIRTTYISAFGPLDPNIVANDIDWHIQEIIKEAAQSNPNQEFSDLLNSLSGEAFEVAQRAFELGKLTVPASIATTQDKMSDEEAYAQSGYRHFMTFDKFKEFRSSGINSQTSKG